MKDALDVFQQSAIAVIGEVEAGRAASVKKKIDALAGRMADHTWELAELLSEAHDRNYPQAWGFEDFDSYFDSPECNFDMSARQARYYIKINNGSKALGIPVEALKKVKITKLKEIFTLDPNKFSEEIHELVDVAKTETLDEIKARIRTIRGQDDQPEMTWRNFLVTREAAENTIDLAIERVKREYGDSMNENNEITDITDGRALEYLAAEKLAEPSSDYIPEAQTDEGEAQQA